MKNHKIIIANWKSNPASSAEALRLAKESVKGAPRNVDVVLCPPFVFLESISKTLNPSAKGGSLPVRQAGASGGKSYILSPQLGAQDIFSEPNGPYTGEVSAEQLKRLGVSYVIVGHSERRRLLHETDEMVNKKVIAALRAGITPILCVGETAEMKKRGIAASKRFVKSQLVKSLRGVSSIIGHQSLVITYEPVWAISTAQGKSKNNADTPENASTMIRFIKRELRTYHLGPKTHFIYGGSVNPKNAKAFLRKPEIEGALVGGASLKPKEFRAIIKSASRI